MKGFTVKELLFVVVLVFLVAYLSQPAFEMVQLKRSRTVCAVNIQKITKAMYIYAKEHGGNFPPALKTLYDEEYVSDRDMADCPGSGHKGTPEEPDYFYTPGLSVRADSSATLVRDDKGNHSGGMNIVTVNGTVIWKKI
jgi:competence protein ComGC